MKDEPRTTRAGLSRETVLEAALALADAEGPEALSFRRLAARLGVTPMALYHHVESKDALLDGIGDLVLSRLELPEAGGADWRAQLAATARSFRSLLVAHPAVVPVVLRRPLVTPAGARAADAVLGLFLRAGFPPDGAVLAYRQTVRFLLALIVLEVESGPRLASRERQARARETRAALEALDPERFPSLVAAAPHLAAPFDPERAFESGVELLTAGLERQLSRR